MFSSRNRIDQKLLKTTRKKKKKLNKLFLLARIKLNSIDNEISLEDFTIVMNEEKKHCKLRENIRMMKSQRSNKEWDKQIDYGKRIGINKVVK